MLIQGASAVALPEKQAGEGHWRGANPRTLTWYQLGVRHILSLSSRDKIATRPVTSCWVRGAFSDLGVPTSTSTELSSDFYVAWYMP